MSASVGSMMLAELNALLDSLGTNSLNIYNVESATASLVIGQQTYTAGPSGADLTIPRSARIDAINVIPSSSPTLEVPVELISDQDWQNTGIKSITSSWPTECLISNGFPLITLDFWPVPSENCDVKVYYWTKLQEFTSLDTVLAMPEGYEDWIVYNLAVEAAPNFQVQVSPEVASRAEETRRMMARMNFRPVITEIDQAWCLDSGASAEAIATNGYLVD